MQPNIIDILGDIVGNLSGNTEVRMSQNGKSKPGITYMFGDAQYIKDQLDAYSKVTGMEKLPLIALFTPIKEKRDYDPEIASEASVSLLIACSSREEWNNDERKVCSFENVLRPIYESLMDAIRQCPDLRKNYDGTIPHVYSENYSYGKYGAYTASGEAVSEPIDAINIRDLKISVKLQNCRRK